MVGIFHCFRVFNKHSTRCFTCLVLFMKNPSTVCSLFKLRVVALKHKNIRGIYFPYNTMFQLRLNISPHINLYCNMVYGIQTVECANVQFFTSGFLSYSLLEFLSDLKIQFLFNSFFSFFVVFRFFFLFFYSFLFFFWCVLKNIPFPSQEEHSILCTCYCNFCDIN